MDKDASLVNSLRNEVNQLSTVNEVSRLINSTLDLEEVLSLVMDKTNEIMRTEACSLLMEDEGTGELSFRVAIGEKGDIVKQLTVKKGQGIAGWVAENGKPLLVPDVKKDPRFYEGVDKQTHFETKSIVAVPLKVRDKIIGAIEIINRLGGESFDWSLYKIYHRELG